MPGGPKAPHYCLNTSVGRVSQRCPVAGDYQTEGRGNTWQNKFTPVLTRENLFRLQHPRCQCPVPVKMTKASVLLLFLPILCRGQEDGSGLDVNYENSYEDAFGDKEYPEEEAVEVLVEERGQCEYR